MCKSTYNSKQVGIFNLQLTSISIPWLLIGGLIIGSIWFSVCLRKHCRRRSKRQVLRQRNLETLNNRMSMISMSLPNQFQFPVAPAVQQYSSTAESHPASPYLCTSRLSYQPQIELSSGLSESEQ